MNRFGTRTRRLLAVAMLGTVGMTHMLADSFYIYAEHMRYDHDDRKGNTTGVGLVYEF